VQTGQHHIIKETSETISDLLTREFEASGYKRVHIIVNAPKPDAIEGKLPAVSLYLYQVSMDDMGMMNRGFEETVEEAGPDGQVREYSRGLPMWVRLDYLISTWAQTPEDEQLLLGLAVRGMIENPTLTGDFLKGDSFGKGFELDLTLSQRLDEGTLSRFWGSLNQPVRPALQVWTSVPVYPEKKSQFQRVTVKGIRYRNLQQLGQGATEQGPGSRLPQSAAGQRKPK
jgi:hypothetical protein